MVAASLAIGLTRPAVRADKSFDSFGRGEDSGKSARSSEVDAYQSPVRYSMNIDHAAKHQLGERTFNEVAMHYQTAQRAIETKNMELLMAQYSDSYRDGDIDKKFVARAWQKIFARADNLATLNNMKLVNISADENVIVLQSSGLLVGVPDDDKRPVTIDSWNTQNHVLVKEAGAWKLIGIYGPEQKRLWFGKPMHPLI